MVRSLLLIIVIILSAAGALNASDWQVETVDNTGAGKFSSLKIDKDGNAHVAYVAEDGKDSLKYGFWDHSLKRWFVMLVDHGASFPSLVLDSKQHPRISYADAGTTPGCKLRYAWWNGNSWEKQALPINSQTVAYYTSLALDANDNPSISFYEYDGPKGTDFRVRIRVVTWNGEYWQIKTVDGQNQSGKFNSMAMDAHGRLHLAYANVNAGTAGLRYALRSGDSWQLEVLDGHEQNNMGNVGYAICLALDEQDNPRITYTNYTNPAVKYAALIGGHWQIEVVDRLKQVAYPDRNSIALDPQGHPYIGYYDAGLGALKLAHRDGQRWVHEIVDEGGSGFTSSLQIDHDLIWISYADEANGGLKVARRKVGISDGVKNSEVVNGQPKD